MSIEVLERVPMLISEALELSEASKQEIIMSQGIENKVAVITGASSGLRTGASWKPCFWTDQAV
ncbi:hypothetical protein ELH91_31985 [Rhizobium leguminosarum]|uniref:hypothetical protein n=1 Tax=Rhizobium leguminosarum TaxID=384 RepID=UPI0010306B1C|nr:hypothetical protein [Rhizobium leguminosarum]TAY05485.1 hypothetical protein ELH91_31985 [Rhizobium leguminosarum]